MHRGNKIGSYIIMHRDHIYMEQGHYAQRDQNRQLGNHAQRQYTRMNQDWQLCTHAQKRYAWGDQDRQSYIYVEQGYCAQRDQNRQLGNHE